MRKSVKKWIKYSSTSLLGTPIIAIACNNDTKSTPQDPVSQPTPVPTPPITQPQRPKEPQPIVDEEKGGELNGLKINKYKGIIQLLNLNSNMPASFNYYAIDRKSFKNANYNISQVIVTDFDDAKSEMTFQVIGNYKDKTLWEDVFKVTGFAKTIPHSSTLAKLEFNTNKMMEEQITASNLVDKPFDVVKKYINNFEISIDNMTISILNNPAFEITNFSISDNSTKYNKKYNLNILVQAKELSMKNGVLQQPTSTYTVFNRVMENPTNLVYSDRDYLNYVLNNQVEVVMNNQAASNYYASYFTGRKQAKIDMWNLIFKINDKYENYNKIPLSMNVEYYSNDLTGTLYLSAQISYDNETYSDVPITSDYINKEITGFKTLNEDTLKQQFTFVPYPAAFNVKKYYQKLVTKYNSLDKEQQKTLSYTPDEAKMILGAKYAPSLRIAYTDEKNELIIDPVIIPSDNAEKDFAQDVDLLFNGTPFAQEVDANQRTVGDNGFQVDRIMLNTTSLNNFTSISDDKTRVDFNWNYDLEIEINNATSWSQSTQTISVPGTAHMYSILRSK
ncbi:hypothetical protein [Mycoplasmopsis verecunda]|uniref:Lipoprotein n=1 Tax=Mycoplasmopsis verecunda TaxID=171291 RepID=A0A1T4LX81_9BACT|nr:hypothetical protein [Mycoplasmopsis verecunda]WPB54570.1 hypothetical protein SAM46_00150 [Mycoplasmopsis verecunda]SJZ59098.1 hypothetical protein SAMN02745154_00562 [Mycoplasmopsis verecunda]